MKIKRYLDKDMRHVLRRVREDQGPDAVILSNRRVPEGIEVIAAIDYDEALVRHAVGMTEGSRATIPSDALARIAEDDRTAERIADRMIGTFAESLAGEIEDKRIDDDELQDDHVEIGGFEVPAARNAAVLSTEVRSNPANEALPADSLKDMQDELSSLRGLIETQLSGLVWKDETERSPLRAQMLRNLARIGVAPDVANIVIDRLEPVADVRSLWHAPLSALAQLLPVNDHEIIKHGGTIALIGPTGVGKTTTIAKIAARFAMVHGADDIALISADSFRIGAKEHLMAFANIIGAKVYSAATSDELTELLMQLSHKKLVLIDTEGRSPRDRDLANRLAAYGNNAERVRFYLTLSAATQEAALDEAIREFRKVPLEGCIVTKIDEAAQLGCVISTLVRHDLPACWFSDGQRIPDDLYPAAKKKMWLINQAIECLEQSAPQIDERTMAEQYSQASAANA
ncbi:MAG: flagellar biosynthesis protein FlhF [Woeseiaceae bacterium]|nr:flagellar biosynthesis protein FlhF [Woeseiaceae bacterium]